LATSGAWLALEIFKECTGRTPFITLLVVQNHRLKLLQLDLHCVATEASCGVAGLTGQTGVLALKVQSHAIRNRVNQVFVNFREQLPAFGGHRLTHIYEDVCDCQLHLGAFVLRARYHIFHPDFVVVIKFALHDARLSENTRDCLDILRFKLGLELRGLVLNHDFRAKRVGLS